MVSNPLTPKSYTNKDFQAIYPELLELVKQLTKKWDPSISNESDPGVILLKLNAIVADKNNYNIDKNILEAFPETVTQDVNARNLYKQLGYSMPWYKSATTTVKVHYSGDELKSENSIIPIKKFTKFTNLKSSVTYTALESANIDVNKRSVQILCAEGSLASVVINNSEIITLSALDDFNRVYFGDTSVAQNCIFISSAQDQDRDISAWHECSNLAVEELGQRVYEFGVDSRNNRCYIEFPQDAAALIGNGIRINYLVSQGSLGSISKGTLDRFQEDIELCIETRTSSDAIEQLQIPLTDVTVTNIDDSTVGADPETIEEAFKGYRKTVGTFSTLVTLRDYLNYITSNTSVSNGIVTDRLTDPQASYLVKTLEDTVSGEYQYVAKTVSNVDISTDDTIVRYKKTADTEMLPEKSYYRMTSSQGMQKVTKWDNAENYYELDDSGVIEMSEDSMSAFDLKLYLFPATDGNMDYETYTKTFSLMPSAEANTLVEGVLSSVKCIQHDFAEIISNTPCLFKNVYSYNVRVVPQRKLSVEEITSVQKSIQQSLMLALQSSRCTFGEEPAYDYIYSTIEQSDSRIKSCFMSDITYVTYAVYWDDKEKRMKELPISGIETSKRVLTVSSLMEAKDQIQKWHVQNETSRIYDTYYLVKNASQETKIYVVTKFPLSALNSVTEHERLIDTDFDGKSGLFCLYSDSFDTFRQDIVAKSILSGATPLFVPVDSIQQNIAEDIIFKSEVTPNSISSQTIVKPFADTDSEKEVIETPCGEILVYSDSSLTSASYTVRDNQTVRFFAPKLKDSQVYSNYIKYYLTGSSTVIDAKSVAKDNYIGEVQIREADYNTVSLYDWRDVSSDTNKTPYIDREGLEPKLCFPEEGSQAILDVKSQTPLYYDYPTKYTIKVQFGSDSAVSLNCLRIWQYTASTCTGEYSVLSFNNENDFTEVDSNNNYLNNSYFIDSTTKTLYITYLKPSNIYSFSLYFCKTSDIEEMSLSDVSVKAWETVTTAPDFVGPKGMKAVRLVDGKTEQFEFTASEITDGTDNPTLDPRDYTIWLPLVNGLGFPGYYEDAGKNEAGITQYSLLLNRPQMWGVDAPSYYKIEEVSSDFVNLKDANASTDFGLEGKTITSWAYIPNFYYERDSETGTFSRIGVPVEETTSDFLTKFYTLDNDYGVYIPEYFVMNNVSWIYSFKNNLSSELARCGSFDGITGSYVWEQRDDTWVTTITDSDPVMHPELQLVSQDKITLYRTTSNYVLPADQTYQLRSGESLTFFWKTQDADYAPYTYQTYTGGQFIKPNFQMSFNTADEVLEDWLEQESFTTSGEILTDSDEYSAVVSLSSDLPGTQQVIIQDIEYTSSSQNETISPIQSYFFESSTKTSDGTTYTMVFVRLSEDSNVFQKILDDGEIFYCVDKKKDRIIAFGAGTLLQLTIDQEKDFVELTSPVVSDVASLTLDDLLRSYKQGVLQTLNSNWLLRCYEQQVTSVGSGSVIRFQLKPSVNDQGRTARVLYSAPVRTESGSFEYCQDRNRVSLYSFGHTLLSSYNIFVDNQPLSISVIDSDNLQLAAKPYLNIITTSSNPQIIEAESTPSTLPVEIQGVSYSMLYFDSENETSTRYPDASQKLVKVYTDVDVNKVGGYDLDLRYTDEDGTVKNPVFSITTVLSDENVENATLNETTGVVTISGECTFEMPSLLERGATYLLTLRNYDKTDPVKLSYVDGSNETLMKPTFGNTSLYNYYILEPSANTQYTGIKFCWDAPSLDKQPFCEVQPLVQISNELMGWEVEGISRDTILEKLVALDFSGKFDYGYSLNNETPISNPLDPKMFFDRVHPFNSVTIAQADTWLNSYRSSVSIVNNRG